MMSASYRGSERAWARRAFFVPLAVTALVASSLFSTMGAGALSHPPRGLPFVTPGTDLGPTRTADVSFVVLLDAPERPTCLESSGRAAGLEVEWTKGQRWALIRGATKTVDRMFGVSIDDYRTRQGTAFAANRPARVPGGACGEVSGVGTIHSLVNPIQEDVPAGGLTSVALMRAYDATPLAQRGLTGRGESVVFLETDGFNPKDLAAFSLAMHLPPASVQVVGRNPVKGDETPMDLEAVHEIAPMAHLIYVNLDGLPGAQSSSVGSVLSSAFAMADQRWRGAVMSISLGFCESGGIFNQNDLNAMDTAVATYEQDGGTVFASSGDAGGLDCTPPNSGGQPPQNSFVGVVEPAALPRVTGVGGTALSTSTVGTWAGETSWSEPLLSQGTGGGVSAAFAQPPWQSAPGTGGQADQNTTRQVPDVSADADPNTGTFIVTGGQAGQGGGTSLAAPIWAGFAVLINAYLHAQHQSSVGFFNPALYGLASGSPPYAPFHDITEGGNDLYPAGPGYDMATGLGSPDVWNLARDLAAGGRS